MVSFPIVRDERTVLKRNIDEAMLTCDLILVNGGSSKGSEDLALDILAKEGDIFFHWVNCGPGRPTAVSYTHLTSCRMALHKAFGRATAAPLDRARARTAGVVSHHGRAYESPRLRQSVPGSRKSQRAPTIRHRCSHGDTRSVALFLRVRSRHADDRRQNSRNLSLIHIFF